MPSLISFLINNVPPSHLDEFSPNDVFTDPEVQGCSHQDNDIAKSFWENNRQEEVTIQIMHEKTTKLTIKMKFP